MSAGTGAAPDTIQDGGTEPAEPADRSDTTLGKIGHGAMRGGIAAWAMTGLRSLTTNLGLVDEPPPRAILRQKSRGSFRLLPRQPRRAGQELFHFFYGAVGGAAFALLPEKARLRPWAGPLYGLTLWFWFELGLAPLLGLSQAKKPRPVDRLALAGDHLLYGFVLSETRRRPRE